MYLEGPVLYFHSIGYNQFQRQFVEQKKGFSKQVDSWKGKMLETDNT